LIQRPFLSMELLSPASWLAMLLPCSLYFSSQRGVRAHAHGKLRELGGTVVLCSTVYVEDLTSRTSAVVVAYVAPFWYRSARMHGYDLAGIRSIHPCIYMTLVRACS
jgi:hypothetical protein